MPEKLSGILIHATGTPPWLHRPVKVSTSSELYPNFFRLPTFFDSSGIQFYDSPPSHLGYLWLPTLTVQHLCDLQDTIPCMRSPDASHPILT